MKDLSTKISIIFPSYNGEIFIAKNLNSIQNLDNVDKIELIIVDNNSIDSTLEIIKSFKNIKKTIIESDTNLGFGKACNLGVQRSKGEFIFITNQDVSFPKDFFVILLDLYNELKKEKEIVICPAIVYPGNYINYFGAKIHFLGFSYTKDMYRKITEKKIFFRTLKASGCSMFMKRSTFIRLKGFDPFFFMYHEDTDLSLKALRFGIPIYTTNKTLLKHQKLHMLINFFTYFHIEQNRFIVLYKNINSMKLLAPFILISELILLFQAILTKKLKLRIKIYKFLIQNYKQIKQLRFSKFNKSVPRLKKRDLDRNLEPIIMGRILGNVKILRLFLKIVNLIL
ncbi:MAG: glycosyltransferase family 2 protein [Promethearchaeota archaeon]